MLDNLDSFTYNLVDEFQCLGYEPTIYRNTLSADFIIAEMEKCCEEAILVLSPGPGNPTNAGCVMTLISLMTLMLTTFLSHDTGCCFSIPHRYSLRRRLHFVHHQRDRV